MRLIDADAIKYHDITIKAGTVLTSDYKHRCVDSSEIAEQPTIDPIRHGHWHKKGDFRGVFCDVCDCYADTIFDFCPNCGAKMDEKGETE